MKNLLLFALFITASSWAQSEPKPVELQRSGRISIFGPFISVSDSLFIEEENNTTEHGTTTEFKSKSTKSEGFSISQGVVSQSKSLSTSASKKITEENGDFIFVSSRADATDRENGDNSASVTHKFEIKRGDKKLEYLGTIRKFGTSPEHTENSITFIETHDFDPCTLEQSSTLKIQGKLNALDKQGKHSIKGNCMIGEKLNGDFFASYIITDEDGELIEQIDLSGSLTLKVSKALTLKYGQSYLRGEDPFDNNGLNQFGQNNGATGIPFAQQQFIGQGLQIGNTTFLNREHIQGRIHELEIDIKNPSEETGCSSGKTLNLKIEDHDDTSEMNKNLFKVSVFRSCENKGSEELSLSNAFEQDGSQAVVLNFSKTIDSKTPLLSSRTKLGFDLAQSLEDEDWFANFNLTHRRINAKGLGSESGFDVFYAENRDSYVVAKHVLIAPVYNSSKFREFQKTAREKGEPVDLNDVNLCFKIDCESVGAAVTFKEDGGVFVSAEGKTIVDIFGKEVNFKATSGFGLNDQAENEGFGSGSFFTNDSENFVELKLESPSCNELTGGCASLGVRKEETSTTFSFGATLKF